MSSKVVVTITKGKLRGEKYFFDSRTACIIGRQSDCNIQLPNDKDHSTISRYHCLLDINPPDVCIRDLGSRHGTYVNHKLIGKRKDNQTPQEGAKANFPEHNLKDGDKITLSNTVLQVKIESAPPVQATYVMPQETLNTIPKQPIVATPSPAKAKSKPKLWDFILNIFQRADRGEQGLEAIKGYTILRKIGEGGFGEVYLSRCNSTKKLVALKVMLPQVAAQPQMVEKFMREIETTKALNHPNLIRLQDCCTSDGLFFLTLEYCNKGTIENLMHQRGGKLSVKEALFITMQILDGLHYAHCQKNLVHRDIKPGNIFLADSPNEDGKTQVKLGDYGLAKNFDMAGLSGQTLTGSAMGTPVFMPRQQVLNFKYALPDVDVWATAATLYYMLTGSYPRNFSGKDPFIAILQSQPIPIQQRKPSIPNALANVIDLASIDNPELHFKSAEDFKNTLLDVERLLF